jgi:hypothetical protein
MQVQAGSPDRSPAGEQLRAPAAPTPRRPAQPRRGRRLLVWLAALVVVAGIALAAYLVFGDSDDGGNSGDSVRRAPAVAASLAQLNALATGTRTPVYWSGAREDTTYELSRTADGRIFIRYLPAGTAVGTAEPGYLTVGTYPQRDALDTLTRTARAQGVTTVQLGSGARAFQDAGRPTSAYLAAPGADVQVEVFDPEPGRALELIRNGTIAPFQALAPAAAAPRAVTIAELRAIAARAGQPIFWAGTESDTTYELTQTSDGRVYVRYLPPGADVDDDAPDYLTVGTYPQAGALAQLKAAAAKSGSTTFDIDGGGLGYVDAKHPTSVYLAFPDSDYQVEVYDADADHARELVTAGAIQPVS